MTASDLDTSDTVKWTVNQPQGKFGTLSIDQHGHWHYQLDNSTGSAADELASGQHQPESFWITATDSAGATVPHKIVIDVQGSNDKPVVSAWTQLPAGKEDQPITIKASDLLTHTSDIDSTDTLNVSNLQAAHGSIIDNKDGTYTFTPDKNFNGEIRLTYSVIDGHGGSVSTQAKFDLTADPDSAVITDAQTNADLRGVTEDRGYIDTHYQLHYDGKFNIQDPDSGEAQFDPNIGPQTYQGIGYDTKLGGHVLLMRDGHYTYTLDNRNIQNLAEGEVKQDSVVIRSVDGTTHTIELSVHGTNDKPTIAAQSHSVTEDGQLLQGQMVGTDIDNGAQLTYSVANPVDGLTLNKDGSYSFDPSNSTYQHLADKQTQTLTIPVTITDEHNSSSTENLTITITGTGDAAIIGGVDTGSVIEKTAGDNMSPNFAHPGMATLGNSVLYADGQLTVVDPDTGEQGFAPHTNAYNYHGTYGDLILNTDGSWHYVADAGSVSHIGGRPTTRGSAIDQLGEGEVLTDTITVHSKDNTPHDIVITIHGSNDRPYCSSEVQLNAGTEDTRQTITVAQLLTNTVDVDHNDAGLLTIENLHPDHGSVAVNADGSFSFTPEKNYNGQVHFTYDVKDGHGGVTHTGATTNLAAVNDNPDVTPITDSVTEDTDSHHSVNLLGTATDIDGDTLTISHIQVTFEGRTGPLPVGVGIAPDGHSLIIDSHSSAFQHLSSGEKSDITIQYMVEDNHGGQAPAVATITVVGSDDKAQLQSSTIDMTESQALHTYYQLGSKVAGTLNLLDPDSTDHTQFSFSGNSGTQGYGNLTIWPDGHYEYDLDMARNHHANDKVASLKAGESLTDQYQVQTSDGQTKVITVTIHGEDNNARIDVSMPHILPATQQVTEEHFVNASSTHLYAGGMLKVIDPDHGDAYLQAETINTAHHGQFKISADGGWNYTIDNSIDEVQKLGAGESFTETHTVHSLDGTASQLLTVTVQGTNDAPVVSAQVKLAPGIEDTDIQLSKSDLLSNATDIDHNDTGHLNITNLVADHGVIVDNKDGTFNFHPAPNYNGQVHFSYDVIDAHGGLAHASAGTTLAAVKDAAVFSVDDTGSVKEDVHVQGDAQHTVAVSGVLLVSDPDAGESEFVANRNVHAVSDPFGGDLSIGRAGDWTYSVPNNNLNRLAEGEKHQVTYEVVSRGGDKHQIVITVIGTNDDPQLSVTQTTPTTGTLTETDVDVKDMHTFSVVSSTGQFGSLSVDPDTGAYVYTANSSVAGMTYNSATHTYHGADVFEVKVADNHGGESSRFLTFDTNGHVTVISGQQPSITTTVPQNPAITKTQPSLPTGSNTPPSNAVTVDLAASSDSGKSNTDNLTNNTTPTIMGHTDIPYSQVTVYDGSTPIGHAVSDSSGQYSIAVSSLSNGDHNLSAKALAPSSALPATSSLLSVHVDTTIAPLTIGLTHDTGSSTSDLITSDGALTITGQEAGATVEYSADNGQTWVSSFTPQQGSNTVSVRQTDAAGNVSASTSLTFTLDDQIAAPSIDLKSSTDSGSSSTDDLTNIHTPIITGSAEANSIISITDETGKVVATGTTNSNGIYQLTTSDIAEGKHTLTVSTTDVAGNQNSATLPIEVDYTAPTISKVNLKTETTHQPTFSGTVSLDTTSVDIVIKSGSTIVETLHATLDGKGGYTVDATNLPDRTYTAYIQATDKAGNTTASGYAGTFDRFTVDTHAAAPTISFESTGADNIYNAAEIASGAANTITSTIHLPSDVNPKDTLTINGHPHLITNAEYLAQSVNVEVAPGASISASITDDNGNTSIVTNATAPNADTNVATLQVALTHDTGSDTSDLITNDGALTITGEEAGATVEYSTDNGHTWTSSFTPQQGANTVSVRQTDVAGNVSSPSSLSFTLDNAIAAPVVSLTVDSGDSHSDKLSNLGMLKVTGETGAEIEYSTDGGTSWTTSFNPTHQGQNSVLVRQTDTAGNSASTTFSFDYDTSKPIFTIVDPGVQSKAIVQLSGTASTDTTSMTVDIVSTGQNQTIATLHPSVDVNGHWSIDTSALGDGDYTIGVYGKDAAGNSSPQFHGRVTGHLLVDTSVSVTDDNNIAVEDSTQRVAGNVLSNDVDANLVITTGDIQGTYGIFHLTADGSYTYALNNQLSVIQQLDTTSPPLVDSIVYTASDNHGNQATAHLAISIQGTDDNLTPTVTGQTVSTNEDTTRTFVTSEFGYSDQDGDALRFVTISSIPSHGLLLLNGNAVTTNQQISKADLDAGHLTFTPISNENGVDYAQFTFTANDGHQNSASATMKLNVNAVNDAATFTGDSGSIGEGTNIHHNVHTTGSATIPDTLICNGHLVISDVDGQGEATLDLKGQPQISQDGTYGHFTITSHGTWVYTADNNNMLIQDLDNGQTLKDSIEVTSKDGTKHSITVTINGTTDDPVLHSLSDSGVQHSGPIEGNLLTGSGTDQGLSGAATDTDSNAHLVLQDIQIKDPVSGYVAVRPGQPHTMTGIGTLAIEANGHYTFTPEAGFTGKVPSMVYRVGDDGGNPIGDSSQNSLSIEVTPPLQHTPTVTGQTVSTNEDITRTITTSEFGYSDQDGDALQFVTISSIPSHGLLLLNGNAVTTNQQISKADLDAGHLTFTPINNENGANYAQFSFTANDGHQNSASATMIVDVNAVNDAPIVGSSFISSLEDKPHTFTTADFKYSDIDGDALNHITITNVTHGVLTLNGTTVNVGDEVSASDVSSLIFTPTHNYFSSGVSGLGAVQFTANDGQVDSKEGSIFINIANVADPTTFGGDSKGVAQEDITLQASGTLTSNDPDGTAGFVAVQGGAGIVGSKGYGHAHIDTNGHWTYDLYNKHPIVQQLSQGQTVTETITVQSADGTHHDIVVTITGTNDLPTVSEKPQAGYVVGQHSLDEDSGLNPAGQLIINDVDGDTTTVALDPAHSAAYGHVVFDSHSGTWVYHLDNNNPTVNALNDNDTLQDKFTLLVDDGHGQKVPQEITMTINGHTDPVPYTPPTISVNVDTGHSHHVTAGITASTIQTYASTLGQHATTVSGHHEIKGHGHSDIIIVNGRLNEEAELEGGNDILYIGGRLTDKEIEGGHGTDTLILGAYNRNTAPHLRDHGEKLSDGHEEMELESIENIILGDGTVLKGHLPPNFPLVTHDHYEVPVNIQAHLSSGDESVSSIRLTHLQQGLTLQSNGHNINANHDGSYTVPANGHLVVVSDRPMNNGHHYFETEVTTHNSVTGVTAVTTEDLQGHIQSHVNPPPPPPPPVQHDEPDSPLTFEASVTIVDDSNNQNEQQHVGVTDSQNHDASHHGAAAYLDALGIKPDTTSTVDHNQPADMDIVLAQVDHQDATTHDQAHLDMSDALEHHDANINHNQDDEHHHHDIDGLPDIDPNS
nr:VCBS domain-containing protein [Vibrio splendidus]